MIRRRQFIAGLGTAAAWPLAARAQQPALPVVGYVSGGSAGAEPPPSDPVVAALRKGLSETGYVPGRNVTFEGHFVEGQYDRLPAVMADLVHRRVAVILASPFAGAITAIAAKAATATIPIVFAVGQDPVKLGLVASLARPGGNATGVNFFTTEVTAKRLELLHKLVPKAVRVAVLINPANLTEGTLRDVQEAARILGLQIQILNATTIGEIDAAFATIARERPDALFVAPDAFFSTRQVQLVSLAARDRIPASYANRPFVAAGGLMSYSGDLTEVWNQVGVYIGRILKGEKPADLPVQQATKFKFVINLSTARALGIEVPPQLLAITDEAIE
jgi:putative ABC transport system substrate-binding protein